MTSHEERNEMLARRILARLKQMDGQVAWVTTLRRNGTIRHIRAGFYSTVAKVHAESSTRDLTGVETSSFGSRSLTFRFTVAPERKIEVTESQVRAALGVSSRSPLADRLVDKLFGKKVRKQDEEEIW